MAPFFNIEDFALKKNITIIIDNKILNDYAEYYFEQHPKAKVPPIKHPFHESINVWMILKRPMMNALKQKWKDFIVWYVDRLGYTSLSIDQCEISQTIYYDTNRRHDLDNGVPKFILDGLVESGMIIDDDSKHVKKLTLRCDTDRDNPRTVIRIRIISLGKREEREEKQDGNDQ